MKDFLFVFRSNLVNNEAQPPPQQMKDRMKPWQDWMGRIAARNQLVSTGSKLAVAGKVVKQKNMVTDGPYIEMKEAIGGYIIVAAASLDEAAALAHDCPILQMGGNVEVRELIAMEENG